MFPSVMTIDGVKLINFINAIDEEKSLLVEKEIEMTIDINRNGEYIGIEIINLKYNLGLNALSGTQWTNGTIKYSYDSDSDSFYLRLCDDMESIDQKTVLAKCQLAEDGNLVSLNWV